MAKLRAAIVEVSNRRPLSTLCFIMVVEALILRVIYLSAGETATTIAAYLCMGVFYLWGRLIARANKNEQD